jgi:hypothetical protein
MPTPKKTGRRRLEIIAEPQWIDQVAAAAVAVDQSLSAYIRTAVNDRMRRDGMTYSGADSKPRGRPTKLESGGQSGDTEPAQKPKGKRG